MTLKSLYAPTGKRVPKGWKIAKFGDVASLRYGKSLAATQRKGGLVPVCGSNGVVGYHDEPLVSAPGIVIGRKGSAGSTRWMDSDFWPIDTTYYVDRAVEDVDDRWLYYAISALRLEGFSEGPVPGLNRNNVANLILKVPSLCEQRKIATILSSVDDAIDKARAAAEQVGVVKRGVMDELLAWVCRKGWEVSTLGDVCTVVGGGTPSRHQKCYWNGDIPWATPTDVTRLTGRTISRTSSTITNSGLSNSAATVLPPFSLLVTTRATIGACAINGVSMATSQGFQSLVPKEGICVDFMYYLIQHQARKLKRLGSGSTYLEVPKRVFSRLVVGVPPNSEQRRIAMILSSLDDTISSSRQLMEHYKYVKQGLMSDLLTGDLRVTADTQAP